MLTSGWPEAPLPDVKLKAMETYLTRTVKSVRDAADKAVLPPKAKKGKAPPHTPHQVRRCARLAGGRACRWVCSCAGNVHAMLDCF